MITYGLEPWASYYADCQDLWWEHWDEIAVQKDRMPMRPDVDVYALLDKVKRLQIVVARDDGIMIGYVLSVIRPHMHYADVLAGYEDAYFLTKSRRKGMVGVKLLREAERCMRAAGVQKAFFMTKVTPELDMSRLFEHMGYTRTDYVYSKWIGED